MAITTATSQQTTNSTTSTVTRAGTPATGDMGIFLVAEDSGATSNTWATATELLDSAAATGIICTAAYRIVAGGDGNPVATHTTERSNHIAFNIPAAEWANDGTAPEISTIATGSSVSPNATAVAPSWHATHGSIFITVAFWDDSAAPTVSAYPSGYTNNNVTNVTATSAGSIAAASRTVTTDVASEDAGAFTLSGTETWGAVTIAVKGLPLSGGAVTLTPPAFTTVAWTGAAPSIQDQIVPDAATAVVWTGAAPSIQISQVLTVPAFTNVTWTGAAPSINREIDPAAFTNVVWTGAVPSIQTTTIGPAAFPNVVFTGAAPSIAITQQITPPAFSNVVFTGAAPSLQVQVVPAAFTAVHFTGAAPSIQRAITPAAFTAVSFTAAAPSLQIQIVPAPFAVFFSGAAPSIDGGGIVAPPPPAPTVTPGAQTTADGGRGPREQTPFDDWTIQMDDEAILELYVLGRTR